MLSAAEVCNEPAQETHQQRGDGHSVAAVLYPHTISSFKIGLTKKVGQHLDIMANSMFQY